MSRKYISVYKKWNKNGVPVSASLYTYVIIQLFAQICLLFTTTKVTVQCIASQHVVAVAADHVHLILV